MFNSLKGKLIVPIIGVLILMVGLNVVYVSFATNDLADSLEQERLETASQMARSYVERLDELNQRRAYGIATSNNLARLVQDWNDNINRSDTRQELIRYLLDRRAEFGLDNFVVVDQSGDVILRTHQLDNYGDSLLGSAHMASALGGEIFTVYSVTAALPIGLSTAAPIVENGEIIGAISAIVNMYTDEFVDSLARTFNAEVTIFAGNTRRASTFRDERGARHIGTEADEHIAAIVLNDDQPYMTAVEIFGVPYLGYYFPLHGWGGTPVGMIFVGFSNASTIAATTTMQILQIVIGVGGLLAAAAVMFVLISRRLKPLGGLQANVREVAAGNFNVNIDKTNISKDEIGEITRDVSNLVDIIRSMVDDLNKLNHQFRVVGDIEYRADSAKYQNAFREMIEGVNVTLNSNVEDVLTILGVLNSIENGDFSVSVSDMPGKKAILPDTIRKVIGNLKNVSGEVNLMIEAAADKGDLSFKIDETKYEGDWRNIMTGLNNIAKSVDIPLQAIRVALEEMKNGNFELDNLLKSIGKAGLPTDPAAYKGVFGEIVGAVNATMLEISSYISEISEDLRALADGNTTKMITRNYVGNFAAIKESFNNISTTLNKTMSEISASSEQVLSGAKQISTSAMDLANGATEQASSVQELNASIDMINQQTKQNADSAQEANTLSNKSTENAEAGNFAMKQMTEAMLQIKESSNSISRINKVIQDIAFQTNLLALNAAVEAARAGEHGKGFAVVAEEVRNLAARSQTSATETTELIESSINQVEVGSDIAGTTAEALEVIVSNANEMLNIINNISVSSREQAEAVAQVSVGLGQISSIVQSNSAVSEEAAAAAEELTSQAELLRQLVSYFKL